MGWSRRRVGTDGKAQYQATYRNAQGRLRTAGTYTTRRTPTVPGCKPSCC